MNSPLIFLFASLASFIGSLQLGPVNLFVIDTVLKGPKKNAYWVAAGGVIPEFIYCGIAVYSGAWLLHNTSVAFVFKILLIVVLTVVGCMYLFKKTKTAAVNSAHNTEEPVAANPSGSFFKGFSLAALNPQLLPFWVFVMVWFNSVPLLEIKSGFNKLAYIAGAGFGALVLLITITETITKYRSKLLKWLNHAWYNKALGCLFFAIAIQQLITLL